METLLLITTLLTNSFLSNQASIEGGALKDYNQNQIEQEIFELNKETTALKKQVDYYQSNYSSDRWTKQKTNKVNPNEQIIIFSGYSLDNVAEKAITSSQLAQIFNDEFGLEIDQIESIHGFEKIYFTKRGFYIQIAIRDLDGNPQSLNEQIAKLKFALQEDAIDLNDLVYLDLRIPERIFYKHQID
jgi:hypothetical protein